MKFAFFNLSFNSVFCKILRTFFTCNLYSFNVFKYIIMSFKFVMTKFFRYFYNIFEMIVWNVVEAFFRSNDIIIYSNNSNSVLKTIFHSSSFFILIKWNEFLNLIEWIISFWLSVVANLSSTKMSNFFFWLCRLIFWN